MTILSSDKKRYRRRYSTAEYIVLGGFFIFCLLALSTSIVTLFVLPVILGEDTYIVSIDSLNKSSDFSMRIYDGIEEPVSAGQSPHTVQLIIETPPLVIGDSLKVIASDENRFISETDCLKRYADHGYYIGSTSLECYATVPYNYISESSVKFRAVLEPVYGEALVTKSISIRYDWKEYESQFWAFIIVLLSFIIPGFILIVLPLAGGMYYVASKHGKHIIYRGEYNLRSLLSFQKCKRNIQNPAGISCISCFLDA